MGGLPPVFIEFLGKSTGFMATSKGVRTELKAVERDGGGSMAKVGAVSKAALMGIGVAAAVAAYKTVRMAADFESSMTQMSTLAHVSKADIKTLGSGVLDLAGQVGFSPTSLSEALYHVESSFASLGIKGPEALAILKVAAQGAAVGHADLVDVTNALDAAIASGIPGVQNYSQAMGALTAIVGSGDMQMQDLADALGTGMLAVVKGYGLSLADVGAGLAVFGDNNLRGAEAATQLRMAVQALAKPADGAAKYFKEFGFSANQLSADMQKGGLKLALTDLSTHMVKAGITSKEQGAVITEMFGKKAGTGLNVLIGQIDRLKSKYPEIAKGATGFAGAWAEQSATFNQRLKGMEAGFQALGIKIGMVLLPYAQKFLTWLQVGAGYITKHRTAVMILASAVGGLLVVGLTAAAVAATMFTASLLANPVTWIVIGIMALVGSLVYLVTHWKQVWGYISSSMPGVAHAFVAVWHTAMAAFHVAWQWAMHAVQAVVKWFDANVLVWLRARAADFSKFWSQNSGEIAQLWDVLWKQIQVVAGIAWAWLSAGITILGAAFKVAWDLISGVVKIAWAIISGVVTFGIHLVLNTVKLVLDILTGHWSKVWGDLVHLVGQAFADIWHFLTGVAKSLWSTLVSVGSDIIHGIISGIEAAGSAILSTLTGIAKNALNGVKSLLGIKSPSRVFADEVGQHIPTGIAMGIMATAHTVHAAVAHSLRKASSRAGHSAVATKMTALGIYLALHLVAGLTGTQKQIQAATDHVLTILMQAHTKASTHLEAYVNRDGLLLERLAKQRDAVATRLKAAQANLVSLQASWTKERDSVAGNIMQGASIVMQSGANGGDPTAGDIVQNMTDQVQAATQFAGNLDRLRQMGLSAELIQQIASGGASQGGGTAAALATANVDQIKQLNAMQSNLTTAANATGGAVADSMYGAGIDSAKGLIRGLQSQESAIEAQMLKIAESMKTAIKRALGIHSPSRVFHEIGQFITAGLKNGVDSSAGGPVGAVTNLATAVTNAGRSRAIPGGTSAGTGGTVVYQTNVTVQVAGSVRSDRDLRDVVQSEMLKLGARNSGTWVPYRRR